MLTGPNANATNVCLRVVVSPDKTMRRRRARKIDITIDVGVLEALKPCDLSAECELWRSSAGSLWLLSIPNRSECCLRKARRWRMIGLTLEMATLVLVLGSAASSRTVVLLESHVSVYVCAWQRDRGSGVSVSVGGSRLTSYVCADTWLGVINASESARCLKLLQTVQEVLERGRNASVCMYVWRVTQAQRARSALTC